MAGILGVALNSAEVASGTAAKTILQIKAAAGHRVKILGWGIFFQGTSVSADPVMVNPCLQTAAVGAGAALVADTNLNKLDPNSAALTTTGNVGDSDSTEPATSRKLGAKYIHPQSGYEVRYPLGQEPVIFGATNQDYFGLVVLAGATVDCVAEIYFEE